MSNWIALAIVGKAFDRMKWLLFRPFNLRLWLKLALVVFFISSFSLNFNGGNIGSDDLSGIDVREHLVYIAVAVVLLLLIGLVIHFISSLMQFVFIDSVVNKEVQITRGLKKYFSEGLSLFLFNLLLTLATIIVIAALIIPLVAAIVYGNIWITIAYAVVAVSLIILTSVTVGLVRLFTTDFAVPLMYSQDRDILSALRKTLKLVKGNLGQTIVYLLMKIVLGIVAFILTMVAFVLLLALAVVLLLSVSLPLIGLITLSSIPLDLSNPVFIVAAAVAVVALIVGLLVFSYAVTLATLPITVFFRYYSILYLQGIDSKTEVLPPELKTVEPKEREDKPAGRKRGRQELKVF